MARKQSSSVSGQALGRDKRIYVGGLNLVLHPHTAKKYIDLIKTLRDERLAIKVRGDDALMIGSFLKHDTPGVYVGEVYKYLNLDSSADWFNTQSMKLATRTDVSAVRIPDHMKPHFKQYAFVFFSDVHRLYFVTKSGADSLSPNLLKKFFEGAAETSVLAEFGEFDVTVIPQSGSTNTLFSLPRISKIELEIKKPNPDDLAGLDGRVEERLKKLQAKKAILGYIEEDSKGLKPDEELKSLAKVAALNGKVVVKGRNEKNEVVSKSTENTPLSEPVTYNPDVQSERGALIEAAWGIRKEL